MAKAVLFYARLRRPPKPCVHIAHSARRTCGLVVERDDVDSISVIAPAPPQGRPETVQHPG
jgi:hypothetical protein